MEFDLTTRFNGWTIRYVIVNNLQNSKSPTTVVNSTKVKCCVQMNSHHIHFKVADMDAMKSGAKKPERRINSQRSGMEHIYI